MVLETKIRVLGVLTAPGVYRLFKHSFRSHGFPFCCNQNEGERPKILCLLAGGLLLSRGMNG